MDEVVCDAPGRVNLIGEHTDYHQGFVLPAIVPQRTAARVRRRSDTVVRVVSREAGERAEFALGGEARTGRWIDYVQGVTYALRSVASPLSGFELTLESEVPLGSGLSSSAALQVSVLRALRQLYGLTFGDLDLARLAHRAETEFVGAPVGIMDQIACSLGRDGEALFLDTRSLAFERVPLPPGADLVIIDSGVKHQHAGGEYVTRRQESFAAADRLGIRFLRDATLRDVTQADLPDVLLRRARHVVSENQRVVETVTALAAGDLRRAGALLHASHVSMRDDYEISTPEIDRLVALGEDDPDVYGARLTGGGFGGAVVMLVRAGCGTNVAEGVQRRHGDRRTATLLPR